MNGDVRLSFDSGREMLRSRCGNRRVAMDDPRHHSAHGLDAQRERSYVQQQHIFCRLGSPGKNMGLHRGAERDNFVRIEFDMWFASEELRHDCTNARDARGPTHKNHLINVFRSKLGVLQRLFCRRDGPLDDRLNQLLELLARNLPLVALAARESYVEFRTWLR